MKYNNILIGADIEYFLQNKLTGEVVSAEGYINGTKDHPYQFDPNNKYFATSLDNILAEVCIPPAKNKAEFYANIKKAIGYINNTIPSDYCTLAFPAAHLNPIYLQTEHSQIFGCEPDFNAYTEWVNQKPEAEDPTLRSAGGHIHTSYDNPYQMYDIHYPDEQIVRGDEVRRQLVKAYDLYLSVPMVLIEPENKRKELYGKAGAYRPKEYGVEYRTISNYYTSSPQLTKWAFDNTKEAINWLNKGNTVDRELGKFVQSTIDGNNKEDARYLINTFKIKTP